MDYINDISKFGGINTGNLEDDQLQNYAYDIKNMNIRNANILQTREAFNVAEDIVNIKFNVVYDVNVNGSVSTAQVKSINGKSYLNLDSIIVPNVLDVLVLDGITDEDSEPIDVKQERFACVWVGTKWMYMIYSSYEDKVNANKKILLNAMLKNKYDKDKTNEQDYEYHFSSVFNLYANGTTSLKEIKEIINEDLNAYEVRTSDDGYYEDVLKTTSTIVPDLSSNTSSSYWKVKSSTRTNEAYKAFTKLNGELKLITKDIVNTDTQTIDINFIRKMFVGGYKTTVDGIQTAMTMDREWMDKLDKFYSDYKTKKDFSVPLVDGTKYISVSDNDSFKVISGNSKVFWSPSTNGSFSYKRFYEHVHLWEGHPNWWDYNTGNRKIYLNVYDRNSKKFDFCLAEATAYFEGSSGFLYPRTWAELELKQTEVVFEITQENLFKLMDKKIMDKNYNPVFYVSLGYNSYDNERDSHFKGMNDGWALTMVPNVTGGTNNFVISNDLKEGYKKKFYTGVMIESEVIMANTNVWKISLEKSFQYARYSPTRIKILAELKDGTEMWLKGDDNNWANMNYQFNNTYEFDIDMHFGSELNNRYNFKRFYLLFERDAVDANDNNNEIYISQILIHDKSVERKFMQTGFQIVRNPKEIEQKNRYSTRIVAGVINNRLIILNDTGLNNVFPGYIAPSTITYELTNNRFGNVSIDDKIFLGTGKKLSWMLVGNNIDSPVSKVNLYFLNSEIDKYIPTANEFTNYGPNILNPITENADGTINWDMKDGIASNFRLTNIRYYNRDSLFPIESVNEEKPLYLKVFALLKDSGIKKEDVLYLWKIKYPNGSAFTTIVDKVKGKDEMQVNLSDVGVHLITIEAYDDGNKTTPLSVLETQITVKPAVEKFKSVNQSFNEIDVSLGTREHYGKLQLYNNGTSYVYNSVAGIHNYFAPGGAVMISRKTKDNVIQLIDWKNIIVAFTEKDGISAISGGGSILNEADAYKVIPLDNDVKILSNYATSDFSDSIAFIDNNYKVKVISQMDVNEQKIETEVLSHQLSHLFDTTDKDTTLQWHEGRLFVFQPKKKNVFVLDTNDQLCWTRWSSDETGIKRGYIFNDSLYAINTNNKVIVKDALPSFNVFDIIFDNNIKMNVADCGVDFDQQYISREIIVGKSTTDYYATSHRHQHKKPTDFIINWYEHNRQVQDTKLNIKLMSQFNPAEWSNIVEGEWNFESTKSFKLNDRIDWNNSSLTHYFSQQWEQHNILTTPNREWTIELNVTGSFISVGSMKLWFRLENQQHYNPWNSRKGV